MAGPKQVPGHIQGRIQGDAIRAERTIYGRVTVLSAAREGSGGVIWTEGRPILCGAAAERAVRTADLRK